MNTTSFAFIKKTMYNILFQSHSGLRFVVFLTLILATLLAFGGWQGKKPFTKGNRILNLLAMIATHLQAVLGFILYFLSPYVQPSNMGETMKNSTLRYWTVEHLIMMLIAVVLITIGNSKSKKATTDVGKHRPIAIFFSIAILIIVVAILQSGRALFGITH